MSQYYTVLTDIGISKLATAQAGGEQVKLHTMHAGTGGGDQFYDLYEEEQLRALTDLIDEGWSSHVHDLSVDSQNPSWVVVEASIPADVGGFTIREVGIKDIDGDLIAIGRFPETYKPVLSDGAAQDLLLRLIIEISNTSNVTLVIDPSMVMASRHYVDDQVQNALDEAKRYADENAFDITLRPLNISPSEGEPGITTTPELVGADYYALYNVPQLYREFQIVFLGQPFSAPVYTAIENPVEGVPAISHTVTQSLNIDTGYQWRYRDRTVAGDVSAWSPVTPFFTANTFIERPGIIEPVSGSIDINETPEIVSTAFSVQNGLDTHQSSSWRILTKAGVTVFEAVEDDENLLSFQVPAGVLEEGKEYHLQVRHHGSSFGASAWSISSIITTAAQFAGAIGDAGGQGFGVGVYPGTLPAGFASMTGTTDKASENYGNYLYDDGSQMVFIPAFYYRIGHENSPRFATYGSNAVDILGAGVFADRQSAQAAGYSLHRAFIDGGAQKAGFFFDKYLNSKNGSVSGKSVKNGVPISLTTSTSYTRSQGMTGCAGQYHDAVTLSRARGAGFNCASVFQFAAIAMLSLAHAQAATSNAHCAWYDSTGVNNFPKGCNNNLSDIDDSSVTFTTAGDSGSNLKPLAGSGNPFAKTTHNGQPSGVADVNGSMWQVALGITTPGTSGTSTTQVSNGDCFVLKESVSLASLTAGFGGATDAWGTAANLATNYDSQPGIMPWGSATGAVYFGNGNNRVFSSDTSGANWLRTGCGIQASNDSMSANGTNLFGRDYCYQYNRHNLFVLCGGYWSDASDAGVFLRNWYHYRSRNFNGVGFRAAAYGL